MECWHCGHKIEVLERVGFRDECPRCGRPAHVCLNCSFYDTSYNNACREPMAERVVDKDRANFCEYFSPGSAQKRDAGKTAAQKSLEELFKKKT